MRKDTVVNVVAETKQAFLQQFDEAAWENFVAIECHSKRERITLRKADDGGWTVVLDRDQRIGFIERNHSAEGGWIATNADFGGPNPLWAMAAFGDCHWAETYHTRREALEGLIRHYYLQGWFHRY